MSRDRLDVLDRFVPLFEPLEPSFEGFLRRRDRRRRRQRLTAGVVGLAVFAAAVWMVAAAGSFGNKGTPAVTGPTAPPASERVGFVGLPPEGAEPSRPESGERVLTLIGRSPPPGGDLDRLWVYADGRIVWDRGGDHPYGANALTTGLLEQRLTPEGVELLRSEVLATGLFERDAAFVSQDGAPWLTILVRDGERVVRVHWARPRLQEDDAVTPTPEQRSALERVDALLTDPASWLPASAWVDREIRAYVPSTFAFCFTGAGQSPSPSLILDSLPERVRALLLTKDLTGYPFHHGVITCAAVTTEEARALAERIEATGAERNQVLNTYRLDYRYTKRGTPRWSISVYFEPYLPHGEFLVCSPCRREVPG